MSEFPQEDLARALLLLLKASLYPMQVTLLGAGVHWECSAGSERRTTRTHCFSANSAAYLTEFHDQLWHGKIVWGRTASAMDTVRAVSCWLSGATFDNLLEEFPFVDADRRRLETLLATVFAQQPVLRSPTESEGGLRWAFEPLGSGMYCLRMSAVDRSTQVKFTAHNEQPDVLFQWEGCSLARARVTLPELGVLLARWLVDRVQPSALGEGLPIGTRVNSSLDAQPWIEILPAAHVYGKATGVEAEFWASWEVLEAFYREAAFPQTPFALQYLANLRQHGFDMTLRAGQSLWNTILSRSRHHGLRADQPSVFFYFQIDHVTVEWQWPGHAWETRLYDSPEVTPEIVALLQALRDCPID